MKTQRGQPLLFCLLFVVIALVSGCGKKSETPQEQAQAAEGTNTPPPKAVFSPNRAPITEPPWSKELQQTLDDAGNVALKYQNAMPYERQKLLAEVAIKIRNAFELYNKETKQTHRVQDLPALLQADPRFAGLSLHSEIAAIFGNENPAVAVPADGNYPSWRVDTTPNEGGKPAVSVAYLRPGTVVDVISATGNFMAEQFDDEKQQTELTQETGRLVSEIESKSQIAPSLFTWHTNESANVWAAKVGVKALYDEVLGSLEVYKGDFFLGVVRSNGALQVWEFRQPFEVQAKRIAPSQEDQLNLGIVMSAEFSLVPDAKGLPAKPFYRTYENGFWSTWGAPPNFGGVSVTAAKRGTVKADSLADFAGFSTLSTAQIEVALTRNETTQDLGQALKADREMDSHQRLEVLRFFCAQNQSDGAAEACNSLLAGQPSVQDLKNAAAALSELFFRLDPPVGADFYNGRLFDYYYSYKNNSSMIPNVQALGEPTFGSTTHPYKQIPAKIVSQLADVYQKIVDAEPDNADARFDLAILYMLTGITRSSSVMDSTSYFARSANCLAIALAKARTKSPASGRDLESIVRTTPTFVPLATCTDDNVERQWGRILNSVNSSDTGYLGRFSKAASYQRAGY